MKIETIVVDTVTSLQEQQYAASKKKPGHDKWFDYGTTLANFMHEIKSMGFTSILILGDPGSGKSYSIKHLPIESTIWYNCDSKRPTWLGGKKTWGLPNNPTEIHHEIPASYQSILDDLRNGIEAGAFEEDRFAFFFGHIEVYKSGNGYREKLRTLGKLANKLQVEANFDIVLYAGVDREEGKEPFYHFQTLNSGYNTARSLEELFQEEKIDNNLSIIVEALKKYE